MIIVELGSKDVRKAISDLGFGHGHFDELDRPITLTEHIGFSPLLSFSLLNVDIGFTITAAGVDDEYWRSVFIEAGTGTALFLGIGYYRGVSFGAINIVWFIVTGAVLLILAHKVTSGYW